MPVRTAGEMEQRNRASRARQRTLSIGSSTAPLTDRFGGRTLVPATRQIKGDAFEVRSARLEQPLHEVGVSTTAG
jgi:hypothetical protein